MDNSKIFLKFSKKLYIDTGYSLHSTVSQGLNRDLLKTLRHSRFAGFQPSLPTRNAPAKCSRRCALCRLCSRAKG